MKSALKLIIILGLACLVALCIAQDSGYLMLQLGGMVIESTLVVFLSLSLILAGFISVIYQLSHQFFMLPEKYAQKTINYWDQKFSAAKQPPSNPKAQIQSLAQQLLKAKDNAPLACKLWQQAPKAATLSPKCQELYIHIIAATKPKRAKHHLQYFLQSQVTSKLLSLFLELEQNHQLRLTSLQALAQSHGSNAAILTALAQTSFDAKHIGQAKDYLEQAKKLQPDHMTFLLSAKISEHEENYPEALAATKQALRLLLNERAENL